MPYKDPEKRKAYKKAYYEANREKVYAYNKTYYEANREKVNAYNRAYYEANPEKVKACTKAWREANPEKVKAFKRTYNNKPLIAAAKIIYVLTGLKKAETPTELLEAQALIIQIHREIRNHEKLHRA